MISKNLIEEYKLNSKLGKQLIIASVGQVNEKRKLR